MFRPSGQNRFETFALRHLDEVVTKGRARLHINALSEYSSQPGAGPASFLTFKSPALTPPHPITTAAVSNSTAERTKSTKLTESPSTGAKSPSVSSTARLPQKPVSSVKPGAWLPTATVPFAAGHHVKGAPSAAAASKVPAQVKPEFQSSSAASNLINNDTIEAAKPRVLVASNTFDPTVRSFDFSANFVEYLKDAGARNRSQATTDSNQYLEAFLQAGTGPARPTASKSTGTETAAAGPTIGSMTKDELGALIRSEVAAALRAQVHSDAQRSAPHGGGHRLEVVKVDVASSPAKPLATEQDNTKSTSDKQKVRHSAICDGCETDIYGVRHKCLDCADFDFCQTCYERDGLDHAGHRFVKIATPDLISPGRSAPLSVHKDCYCDGHLCREDREETGRQFYIRGVRYACLICDDVDFCARCQSHPAHEHPASHPLIRFAEPQSSKQHKTALALAKHNAQSTLSRDTAPSDAPLADACSAVKSAFAQHFATTTDLAARLQPTQAQRTQHLNIFCDCCDEVPVGARYVCLDCDDYDLCETCFDAGKHDASHTFIRHLKRVSMSSARPAAKHVAELIEHACDKCASEIPKTSRRWHCAACADFDLCDKCVKDGSAEHNFAHPMHIIPGQVVEVKPARYLSRAASPEVDFVQRADTKHDGHKTVADLSAKLVESRGVADCSIVVTSGLFTKQWLLENDGGYMWPPGSQIVHVGGATLNESSRSIDMVQGVQPGDQALATVSIVAPEQPRNNVISYWQMQTPAGVLFGPKLWLDIDVKDLGAAETPAIETRPQTGESKLSGSSSELILPTASTELTRDVDTSTVRTTSQAHASPLTGPRSSADDDDVTSCEDVTIDLTRQTPATERDQYFSDDEYDLLDNDSLSDFPNGPQ